MRILRLPFATIRSACPRCGTETFSFVGSFLHDVRCWSWHTAWHNLWYIVRRDYRIEG